MSQRPHLVGRLGQELGALIGRMGQLIAPVADRAGCAQQPVHRALGGEVAAFIEQRGIDLGRGGIDKAWAVELLEDRRALLVTECAGGSRARAPGPHRRRGAPAVERGPRGAKGPACRQRADQRLDLCDGGVDHRDSVCSSISVALLESRSSKSAETFPCTSMTRRAVLKIGFGALKPAAKCAQFNLCGALPERATLSRRETHKRPDVALLAPGGKVRAVEALAAQHRPDLACSRAGARLTHDTQLVLRH